VAEMKNKSPNTSRFLGRVSLAVLLLVSARPLMAQDPVPVDEEGNPLAVISSEAVENSIIDSQLPVFSANELKEVVGPIALYPDNILAIVLPASTYPLQIVLAQRFLEDLESDSTLQPDESWDESVVALLNYPEVIQMMNENIQWTWQLGEAVVDQETDVLDAIASFRELAYTAGNLQSDEYQEVSNSDETIVITQTNETVVYIPYYVPEEVIVYQPRPVYHYYPSAYPVYYYPYATGHRFRSGFFWGVTTAFSIGWFDHQLHVYHPSYRRHPYYGRQYHYGYNYRRNDIRTFNRFYVNNNYRRSRDRYRDGSYWQPQRGSGARPYNRRDRSLRAASRSQSALNGNRRLTSERGNNRSRVDRVRNQASGNLEDRLNRGGVTRANRSGDSNRNIASGGAAGRAFNNNNANTRTRNTTTRSADRRRDANVNSSRNTGSDRRTAISSSANPNVLTNNRRSQSTDQRRQGIASSNRRTRTDSRGGAVTNSIGNATTNAARARSSSINRVRTQSSTDRLNAENRQRRDANSAQAVSRNRTSINARSSSRQQSPSASRTRQQRQLSPQWRNNQVTNRSNSSSSRVDRNRRTSAIESRTRQTNRASSRQRSAPPARRSESSRGNRASAPSASRSAPSSSRRSNSGNSRRERSNRREP